MKTVKFLQYNCKVCITRYSNDKIAIQLFDVEDNSTVATASINLPHIELEKDEVIIKDYSENEGLLQVLLDAKIVETTGKSINVGYVKVQICKLIN
jgi:hypothetical protein